MVRVFSARVEPTMVFRAEKLPETSNPEACPARLRKHRKVSRKTPKTRAQTPLDASKKLPQACQKTPKGVPASRQKPSQMLQNHLSNPSREFGQNRSRKPPNSGRPKIALALRFPLFFHFSRTCFAPPFWNLPAPFLDPSLGLPMFRFKCRYIYIYHHISIHIRGLTWDG